MSLGASSLTLWLIDLSGLCQTVQHLRCEGQRSFYDRNCQHTVLTHPPHIKEQSRLRLMHQHHDPNACLACADSSGVLGDVDA